MTRIWRLFWSFWKTRTLPILAILPDNGTYVEDDAVLNDAFLQKYGPSFYINGNLSLNQASTPLISRLKNPHIDGTVLLSADQEAAFLAY